MERFGVAPSRSTFGKPLTKKRRQANSELFFLYILQPYQRLTVRSVSGFGVGFFSKLPQPDDEQFT
jgi:hypothetical protein